MLIQLTNIPVETTIEDIDDLLEHIDIIDRIKIIECEKPERAFAWIHLECSQVGGNAICEVLKHRLLKGQHICAYAYLYSHR